MSSTYVYAVPVTSASSTIALRAIVTALSNISTVQTGAGIDLNIITFT